MRAAVVDRYGSPEVMRIAEIDAPTTRSDGVLIRVHATAVTAADSRIRAARFPTGFGAPGRAVFGVRRPRRRILGGVFSGVVESVGTEVADIRIGDRVCGMTGIGMGAHAELIAVRSSRIVPVPDGVSHDDAAGVLFGGPTALHLLRHRATLVAGSSVLVNGAAGAVGSNAVQLAVHLGATVTAVAGPAHRDLLLGLGAARVHDHTAIPVTAVTERFDVVLDAVGNVTPTIGRRLTTADGIVLLAVATLWQTLTARGRVKAGATPERVEDAALLLELVASGKLRVVVDGVYPLADIVAAHARVDSGHKTGNLILRPQE